MQISSRPSLHVEVLYPAKPRDLAVLHLVGIFFFFGYAGNLKCARRIVANYLNKTFELQRMSSQQKVSRVFLFVCYFQHVRRKKVLKNARFTDSE